MGGFLFRGSILERETADIGRPVGNARHGKIYARRDLILEVVPARHDVAGPERRSRALRAAKARPRKDEGADIRLRRQLALIHAFAMHQRVAVDAGRAEIGRASCRERVWQYVSISVVALSLNNKKNEAQHNSTY